MSKTVIKYGLSTDYVSTWGYKEAVREIVQNFMDFGEYQVSESDYDAEIDGTYIRYKNEYEPESFEFFKVGFSKKHNAQAVGKYGEGLKIALLVLRRLDVKVSIGCTINGVATVFKPVFYEDQYLGSCFGIEVEEFSSNASIEGFSVAFQRTPIYDDMEHYFVKNECEVIFSNSNGAIVDMPAGNLYVGGIFVTNFSDMPRAYNLNPSDVDLGRDRNFPNTWDVEYHCSKVFQAYCEEQDTILKHSRREVSHMDKLPESFVGSVEPMMLNGEMVYSFSVGVLSGGIADAAERNPTIKEKVKKLKVELTKRQSPLKILEKFHENYGWHWSSDLGAKVDMDIILEKVKHW